MPFPLFLGAGTHLSAVEDLMARLCLETAPGAMGGELGRILWEHISSGGKRFRSRLALSTIHALGGQPRDAVAWAACCELLHNASLIHDDIEDGDRLRRGQETVWARYGLAPAINAGDLCIALSYLAIDEVAAPEALRWALTRTVARASRLIVEGQALEMRLLTSGVPTWADYAACVEGKTSALFSLPIEGSALLAGRSREEAAMLGEQVRPLGLLFQIQDDILDLWGDNRREFRGTDLAQPGKATALVVEHLRLHPGDTAWLVDILTRPRAETSQAEIEAVIDTFRRGGALRAVWERIDELRSRLASTLPSSHPTLEVIVQKFIAEALAPIEHTREH